MKLQKYACRIFAVMLIIVTSSCVDNNYRIDEVSTEVTIASGKTTLPIGYLENKTLGDLLAGLEVEGLSVDADGNYSFSISGEGESVKIDGVQNSFSVPAAQNKFNIDCPSFSLDAAGVTVNEENPINVDLGSSLPSTSGTLPESLVAYMPNIVGTFSKTIGGDDMHLLFDVPEQVENINKIMFKDIESGHKGAPMHLTLDLNGLAGINGGGNVNFYVTLNGGKFRVLDAEGELLFDGNEYESTYTVEAGDKEVSFVMYVESIENTTSLNDKHQLDIPLELTCNVEFDLDVKAGDFDLGADPLFKLNADFEFGDAEIALSDTKLFEYNPEEPQKVKISNLPKDMIKSVNIIELADGTALSFSAEGLDWLGDELAEGVGVEVKLPDYLVLSEGEGYELSGNKITTSMASIIDGINLNLERLDFGTEGIAPDAEGTIELDLNFAISASFAKDKFLISELMFEDGAKQIITNMEMELAIESVSALIDYTYSIEESFKINTESMNIGDVEIGGVGLSPVIVINLENPLTIPLRVDAQLSDDTGREQKFENIAINAATYSNGVIVPAKNKIVIASQKPEYECTFVQVDFDELFKGTLPSQLNVKLDVSLDSSSMQKLYVADSFEIKYDYALELPVTLNDKLDISYADEFGGLNQIFSQIPNYNIKLGDVVIVAEVENTTPLAFDAQVVLKDLNGEDSNAVLSFDEGYDRINGSKDGVTPEKSTLRINVNNVDGTGVAILDFAKVDGVSFSLSAQSDAESDVAINKNQTVGAKLWLELDGGITVDVKDFFEGNN